MTGGASKSKDVDLLTSLWLFVIIYLAVLVDSGCMLHWDIKRAPMVLASVRVMNSLCDHIFYVDYGKGSGNLPLLVYNRVDHPSSGGLVSRPASQFLVPTNTKSLFLSTTLGAI